MNGFIQIGVTAARDPMTGDFLPAVPLYIEATDAAQKSADGLIEDAVALGAGVQFAAVSGATCLWFIASEGISVIENAAQMGVPIPKVMKQALEVMKGNDNGTAKYDNNKNDVKPEYPNDYDF